MKNIKLLGLDKTYKQWLTLMAIFMGGGTIYKLAYIRDVYYTQMMAATGATNVQMGLMMTAFAATCVFCFLPGGWLVDLFPAKYLVSAGLIITGIAGLVEATLPPMKVILVIQGIYGISTTLLFWESMFKGVRLLGNKNEQGRLFGILEGGRGITGTVISFISLAVYAKLGSDKLGMRGAMFVYAIALIIFGLIALFMIGKKRSGRTRGCNQSIKGSWEGMYIAKGVDRRLHRVDGLCFLQRPELFQPLSCQGTGSVSNCNIGYFDRAYVSVRHYLRTHCRHDCR